MQILQNNETIKGLSNKKPDVWKRLVIGHILESRDRFKNKTMDQILEDVIIPLEDEKNFTKPTKYALQDANYLALAIYDRCRIESAATKGDKILAEIKREIEEIDSILAVDNKKADLVYTKSSEQTNQLKYRKQILKNLLNICEKL